MQTLDSSPHNSDIEASIIGCCLVSPDAVRIAIEMLNPKHFYIPKHRKYFEIILNRRGVIDELILDDILRVTNEQNREFIGQCVAGASPTNIEAHCEIILDRYYDRLAIDKINADIDLVQQNKGRQVLGISTMLSDVNDLYKILAAPPPHPTDLIDKIAFHGSKIMLSAPSKARKTFFQLHLGLSIATGTPWLGHGVKQGRVLYLNLELHPWSLQDRCRTILQKMGVTLQSDMFDIINLRGRVITIEWIQRELTKQIMTKNYALICVDPLYKILGDRAENISGDMADLLGRLEEFAHDAQSAIILAHHFAKGNAASKTAIDRGAGSGVVARDGDTIITLTPHSEEDCFSFEMTLRSHAPVNPTTLRWVYPMFEPTDLDPYDLEQSNQIRQPITNADVLAACTTTPQIRAVILTAIQRATGRGDRAAKTALANAVAAGLIKTERFSTTGLNPPVKFFKP